MPRQQAPYGSLGEEARKKILIEARKHLRELGRGDAVSVLYDLMCSSIGKAAQQVTK